MASRPIFSDIDYSAFTNGDQSKVHHVDDPFAARAKRARKKGTRVPLKPSEWVEHFVRVKDGEKGAVKKLDFNERPYLRRPYDTQASEVLLMTSRQTEKSTTLGNKLLSLCGMKTFHSALFVSPSAMQTKVFSSARLDDIVEISPLVKGMTHVSLTMNILEKEFLTHSKIYLRYAFLNADRIRGISVNSVFCDEVQDLLMDTMPVIKETASHFRNSTYWYSGTPKTYDNTIEDLWSKQSTQSEWCIPCEHHTPWHWVVLAPNNIGKTGPICEKCGHAINPEHPQAQWVQMNPGAYIEGFRICRLMVPWYWKPNHEEEDPYKEWRKIIQAMETYPTAKFMNEIMAMSYDSGLKPLTRAEVARACDESNTYLMDEEQVVELGKRYQLYAGIDWGTGEGSSFSVFVVGGYTRNDTGFQILYAKRFDGPLADPELQMSEMIRLIRAFRIKFVGADYGMGFVQNKKLSSIFGPKRVHQFQYAAKMPNKVRYKGALHRYLVFRTPVMADIFSAIKAVKIRFPAWDVWKAPYADDFLSIHSEYSDTMRMIKYDKPRTKSDDTFHAVLFCFLASFHDHRRPDIMAPIQEATTEEANERVREDFAISELEAHVANDPGLDAEPW